MGPHQDTSVTDRHVRTTRSTGPAPDTPRLGVRRTASRRQFLAAGATATAASLVGCLGGTASSADPGGDGGPEPPWTTEQLAEQVEDGSTLTLYVGASDTSSWEQLVSIVNEEFGTAVEPEIFNSDGGEISQRFIQERQAGEDRCDVITYANDIDDKIREDGRSVAETYYEMGVDENFWFTDVLPEERVLPWWVSAYNGGPSTVTPINRDVFEERGLDYPTTYNDLFDDQYEGLEAVLPSYIVATSIGWVITHHAAQTEMTNREWMERLSDHLDFVGASSHTAGARMVAEGRAPMMFYNFPNTVAPMVEDFPLEPHFVDPVQARMWAGPLAMNKQAPNQWAARFFVSAVPEAVVQRRIMAEIPDMTPVRRDIDYDPDTVGPFKRTLWEANVTPVTFEESVETVAVGRKARSEWISL